MFAKSLVGLVGIGLLGAASSSQAALLSSVVKADLSGGVGSTPRLTMSQNGTDPYGYGTTINVSTTTIDSIGLFGNILSGSEYLGGSGNSGGGGIAASGGDTTSNNSTTTGTIARSFNAPASTAGTLTVTGFAFASGANVGSSPFVGSNRTVTLRLAVLWFGADGASGGTGANADTYLSIGANNFVTVDATAYQNDTSTGTSSGTQIAAAYYVKLDPADYLTLGITTNNGTSVLNRFRIDVRPATNDPGLLRMKTASSTLTSFTDSRVTLAGYFTPNETPEPASLSLLALTGAAALRRRRHV